jgi:hypothetical protein
MCPLRIRVFYNRATHVEKLEFQAGHMDRPGRWRVGGVLEHHSERVNIFFRL